MTEAQVIDGLTAIFREVFHREIKVTPGLAANGVEGWDSIKQIEIIMATEEKFKCKFITKEIDSLENVGALVKLVMSKVK
jgi:acyl carrier protein